MEKFAVSRDDSIYEAFPDVGLTPTGRLVCVFAECTHHADRSYTRVMLADSTDRGRTWSPKRPLTDPLHRKAESDPAWNCPRISTLSDGRLVVVVDRGGENVLFFSEDEGATWTGPHETPAVGIVPDRVIELRGGAHAGRWILSCHKRFRNASPETWKERCWVSDDGGASWSEPVTVAESSELRLCEGSVMELPDGVLACFLRENSGLGRDAYKSLSFDGGESWEGPDRFPLPGCHRPTAGMLADGKVLVTHRFMQGGKGWAGWWTQNAFAALTDVESVLARERGGAHTRILPLDFDRSPESDTGYTGWVQFDDGEIYVVNYILDDAPKGQIRGYSLRMEDFLVQP